MEGQVEMTKRGANRWKQKQGNHGRGLIKATDLCCL